MAVSNNFQKLCDTRKGIYGQYGVYQSILADIASDRILYLAVPKRSYEGIFTEKLGQLILKSLKIKLLVFDDEERRIIQWIP